MEDSIHDLSRSISEQSSQPPGPLQCPPGDLVPHDEISDDEVTGDTTLGDTTSPNNTPAESIVSNTNIQEDTVTQPDGIIPDHTITVSYKTPVVSCPNDNSVPPSSPLGLVQVSSSSQESTRQAATGRNVSAASLISDNGSRSVLGADGSEFGIELAMLAPSPLGTCSTDQLMHAPSSSTQALQGRCSPPGRQVRGTTEPKRALKPNFKPITLRWPFSVMLVMVMAGLFAFLEYGFQSLPPLRYTLLDVNHPAPASNGTIPGPPPNVLVARPPEEDYPTPFLPVDTYCGWRAPYWEVHLMGIRNRMPCPGEPDNCWMMYVMVNILEKIGTFYGDDPSWCPCRLLMEPPNKDWGLVDPSKAALFWDTSDRGCSSAMMAIASWRRWRYVPFSTLATITSTPFMGGPTELGFEVGEDGYLSTPPLQWGSFLPWYYPSTDGEGSILIPLMTRVAGLDEVDVWGNQIKSTDSALFPDRWPTLQEIQHFTMTADEGVVVTWTTPTDCFQRPHNPSCNFTLTRPDMSALVWWTLPLSRPGHGAWSAESVLTNTLSSLGSSSTLIASVSPNPGQVISQPATSTSVPLPTHAHISATSSTPTCCDSSTSGPLGTSDGDDPSAKNNDMDSSKLSQGSATRPFSELLRSSPQQSTTQLSSARSGSGHQAPAAPVITKGPSLSRVRSSTKNQPKVSITSSAKRIAATLHSVSDNTQGSPTTPFSEALGSSPQKGTTQPSSARSGSSQRAPTSPVITRGPTLSRFTRAYQPKISRTSSAKRTAAALQGVSDSAITIQFTSPVQDSPSHVTSIISAMSESQNSGPDLMTLEVPQDENYGNDDGWEEPPPSSASDLDPAYQVEQTHTPGRWVSLPPANYGIGGNWKPPPRESGPITPCSQSQYFNLRSEAAYLMVSVVPVLLSTVLLILLQVLLSGLNSILPFRALGQEQGALPEDSLSLCKSPSIMEAPFIAVRYLRQFRDPLPLLGTLATACATVLVTMSTEVIRLEATPDCRKKPMQLDKNGNKVPVVDDTRVFQLCAVGLRKSNAFMRVAESLLVIMAVLVIYIAFLLARWRSGVAADPWSIASIASMISPADHELLHLLQSAPESLSAAKTRDLRRALDGRRFRLQFRPSSLGGESQPSSPGNYGIQVVPISTQDTTPIRPTARGPPTRKPIAADKRDKKRRPWDISSSAWELAARTLALVMITGLLILVLCYETIVDTDTSFEAFMNSQTIGVRILFAAFGTTIDAFWNYYFSCKRFIHTPRVPFQ